MQGHEKLGGGGVHLRITRDQGMGDKCWRMLGQTAGTPTMMRATWMAIGTSGPLPPLGPFGVHFSHHPEASFGLGNNFLLDGRRGLGKFQQKCFKPDAHAIVKSAALGGGHFSPVNAMEPAGRWVKKWKLRHFAFVGCHQLGYGRIVVGGRSGPSDKVPPEDGGDQNQQGSEHDNVAFLSLFHVRSP